MSLPPASENLTTPPVTKQGFLSESKPNTVPINPNLHLHNVNLTIISVMIFMVILIIFASFFMLDYFQEPKNETSLIVDQVSVVTSPKPLATPIANKELTINDRILLVDKSFLKADQELVFLNSLFLDEQGDLEQTPDVADLNLRAVKELNRRLTIINNLMTKTNLSMRLSTSNEHSSSSNKESVKSEIQSQISSQTKMKEELNLADDLASVSAIVKNISSGYENFYIVITKVGLILLSDSIVDSTTQVATISGVIDTKLTNLKSPTPEVKNLNKNYTDTKLKFSNSQKNVESIQNNLLRSNVKVTRATLLDNQKTLQTAISSLKESFETIKGILSIVVNL